METMEIVLLIMGIGAFVVSFFIPERKSTSEINEELLKEQLNQVVDDELEKTKTHLEEVTEETVSYAMEKTERSLDRMANEKIMAIGEYSDTIMSQLNSNHQETVFMHDMLNSNKQALEDLMNTAVKTSKEANEKAIEASTAATQALEETKVAKERAAEITQITVVAEERMLQARKNIQGENCKNQDEASEEKTAHAESKSGVKGKASAKKKSVKQEEQLSFEEDLIAPDTSVSLQFEPGNENSSNNNERILELHRKGRSNMAIAKELGLGIGEVRLVIDLFNKK